MLLIEMNIAKCHVGTGVHYVKSTIEFDEKVRCSCISQSWLSATYWLKEDVAFQTFIQVLLKICSNLLEGLQGYLSRVFYGFSSPPSYDTMRCVKSR